MSISKSICIYSIVAQGFHSDSDLIWGNKTRKSSADAGQVAILNLKLYSFCQRLLSHLQQHVMNRWTFLYFMFLPGVRSPSSHVYYVAGAKMQLSKPSIKNLNHPVWLMMNWPGLHFVIYVTWFASVVETSQPQPQATLITPDHCWPESNLYRTWAQTMQGCWEIRTLQFVWGSGNVPALNARTLWRQMPPSAPWNLQRLSS